MNGQLRKREKFKSKWVLADEQARKNGIRCKIYETNGNTYAGEWKDNKRHGKGSYFWKETHLVYEGDWLEGNRTGYGMISHQTEKGDLRKLYAGNWHMNKRHGQGTYFYENGDYYEGEWVNDVREGWGKMMHSNGDSYEGYWSNNLRHGLGMYIFANGDRYEGGWHEDVRHGEGKFFFRKKRRLYEGEWNMNTPIHGEFTDIVGHEDDLDYESVNRNQLDETIMLPKDRDKFETERFKKMFDEFDTVVVDKYYEEINEKEMETIDDFARIAKECVHNYRTFRSR